MTVSPEVAEAVRRVREMKDYIAADKAADKIRDQQLADAITAVDATQKKLDDLQAKLDALPVNWKLSQEDKDALQHAFDDADQAQSVATGALSQAAETHDELKTAVPENVEAPANPPQAAPAEPAAVPSVAEVQAEQQKKYDGMTAEEMAEERGREKAAGSQPSPQMQAPLMPNLAFDPAGTNTSPPPPGAGQPQQAPAIETAGGFVVAGGGATQRAPGSDPQNPSSTVVVPQEAIDAAAVDEDGNPIMPKAPVSTADEVKSGLGDSSQNALTDNEGKVPPSAAEQQETEAKQSPQP